MFFIVPKSYCPPWKRRWKISDWNIWTCIWFIGRWRTRETVKICFPRTPTASSSTKELTISIHTVQWRNLLTWDSPKASEFPISTHVRSIGSLQTVKFQSRKSLQKMKERIFDWEIDFHLIFFISTNPSRYQPSWVSSLLESDQVEAALRIEKHLIDGLFAFGQSSTTMGGERSVVRQEIGFTWAA